MCCSTAERMNAQEKAKTLSWTSKQVAQYKWNECYLYWELVFIFKMFWYWRTLVKLTTEASNKHADQDKRSTKDWGPRPLQKWTVTSLQRRLHTVWSVPVPLITSYQCKNGTTENIFKQFQILQIYPFQKWMADIHILSATLPITQCVVMKLTVPFAKWKSPHVVLLPKSYSTAKWVTVAE